MSAESSVYLGTGRRKSSTARVRIFAGSGKTVVNDRKFEVYFTHDNFVKRALAPLVTADSKDKFDVSVNVAGGGTVRERQKPQVDIVTGRNGRGIGVDELQLLRPGATQRGNDLGHGLARVLSRGNRRQLDLGVTQQGLDQNFTGVTRCADNADIHVSERKTLRNTRGESSSFVSRK